jgi:hypothetical protein
MWLKWHRGHQADAAGRVAVLAEERGDPRDERVAQEVADEVPLGDRVAEHSDGDAGGAGGAVGGRRRGCEYGEQEGEREPPKQACEQGVRHLFAAMSKGRDGVMKRVSSMLLGLAAAFAVLVPGAGSAAAGAVPQAHAAATCSLVGAYTNLGPTYVEKLSVHGVSCNTGKKVVTLYYRCRLRHGGVKGTCSSAGGYRCSEKRQGGSPVEFVASVHCTKGRDVVDHTYTQSF